MRTNLMMKMILEHFDEDKSNDEYDIGNMSDVYNPDSLGVEDYDD